MQPVFEAPQARPTLPPQHRPPQLLPQSRKRACAIINIPTIVIVITRIKCACVIINIPIIAIVIIGIKRTCASVIIATIATNVIVIIGIIIITNVTSAMSLLL